MALVGLIRVSTDKQNTDRQRDALAPICVKVFEEHVSGKLAVADRPALSEALAYLRTGDMLTVLEVDRLGRDTLTGLITLSELFSKGVHVRVLSGIGAGDHTQMSLILELAMVLASERRRDIVAKTKSGLDAARSRGRVGGRRPSMTPALITQAIALRDAGMTLRQIQPHLTIEAGKNKGKNPSVGAISQALKAHDAGVQETATPEEVNTPAVPVELPEHQEVTEVPAAPVEIPAPVAVRIVLPAVVAQFVQDGHDGFDGFELAKVAWQKSGGCAVTATLAEHRAMLDYCGVLADADAENDAAERKAWKTYARRIQAAVN